MAGSPNIAACVRTSSASQDPRQRGFRRSSDTPLCLWHGTADDVRQRPGDGGRKGSDPRSVRRCRGVLHSARQARRRHRDCRHRVGGEGRSAARARRRRYDRLHARGFRPGDLRALREACAAWAGSNRGVDVVVNYTGGDTWTRSLRVLRVGGRLLTCGATAGYDPPEDIRFIWTFELQILGSNGWAREDIMALLEMVQSGRLKAVVDATYPLERTAEALTRLEDRQVFGKLVIVP